MLRSRRSDRRAIATMIAMVGMIVCVIGGIAIGYSFLALNPSSPLMTSVVSHETSSVTTTTTVVQTVTPSGSETLLNAQSEVIPDGQGSIALSYSIPYDGYLIITYTSTNNIHWSYSYGSTTISTPSASSENGLIVPVLSGSLTLSMENDNCNIFGCGSNSAVVTLTYAYGGSTFGGSPPSQITQTTNTS